MIIFLGKGKKKYSRSARIDRMAMLGNLHMEGEGGGEGGGGATVTLEDLQKQMATLTASNEALMKKNKEILGTNNQLKDTLRNFDGIDAEKTRDLLAKIEADDELKLLTEGKHDEVVKLRTSKIEGKYKGEIDKLTKGITEKDSVIETQNKTIRKLVIDNKVTQAFVSEGGFDTAISDALFRANGEFSVVDGEAVIQDKDGNIVMGANGPKTVQEWVADLKQKAPHLFPGSVGAGVSGSDKNKGKGGTNLSQIETQMQAALKAGNTDEYSRLREQKRKLQSGN